MERRWMALWVGLFICISLFFQNCTGEKAKTNAEPSPAGASEAKSVV